MRALSLALVAVAGAGCAHLEVEVAIFDRSHWSSPEYVEKVSSEQIADAVVGIRDGRFYRQREQLKSQVGEIVSKQVKAPATVEKVRSEVEKTVDGVFEQARASIESAFKRVRESRGPGVTEQQALERLADARKDYASAQAQLLSLQSNLPDVVRKVLAESTAEQKHTPASATDGTDRIKNDVSGAAAAASEALIGSQGIMADPRAAEVIYAPDARWLKSINQTLCDGWWGNSDCAVKMEGVGSFTIKGVRLDASRITQATFQVANTSLQVLTAVSGVPVPRGTAPGATPTGGTTPVATPDVSAARTRQLDAEASMLLLRGSRVALIDAVVAERSKLQGAAAERDGAIQRVQAAIAAHQPILDPPTPGTAP